MWPGGAQVELVVAQRLWNVQNKRGAALKQVKQAVERLKACKARPAILSEVRWTCSCFCGRGICICLDTWAGQEPSYRVCGGARLRCVPCSFHPCTGTPRWGGTASLGRKAPSARCGLGWLLCRAAQACCTLADMYFATQQLPLAEGAVRDARGYAIEVRWPRCCFSTACGITTQGQYG